MKPTIRITLISFAAGIFGAFIFSIFFPRTETTYIQNTENALVGLANSKQSATGDDFVFASNLSRPSVVYITTVSNNTQNNLFDWYFNNQGNQASSSGSGVIYTSEGYIITNNHVIEKSDKIEVIHEKRTYQAKIIGTDPSTDLALLKIEGKDLPAIKIGNSKDLKIGEWVLAVGNPFNLTSTVTAGIVSAKARNINVVNSQFPLESFIQTDAAINPGNSGGALVNTRGELVGINTAILSRTGSYAGYGFAVPVDIVSKVMKDLIKYGEVQKGFFGAEVAEINTATAQQLKLNDLSGVLITYIQKDGGADKIGLKKGDIILKLNDQEINSKSGFDEYLSYFNPGDKIKITYKSENKSKEAYLILTNREGTTEIIRHETFTSESLGADLEVISKVEKDKLNLTGGVRVLNIKNGLIRRLGISEGFIITSVNKVPITTPAELVDIMEKVRGRVMIEGITSNGVRGYYNYYF
ncbi:MAG TPA: trypsin-like peptidase domain-containing protein [Cytophagaceae bacterium]|nr:trypsin-like peptidase domain-containing protein [Cytophagaceae bacterium]